MSLQTISYCTLVFPQLPTDQISLFSLFDFSWVIDTDFRKFNEALKPDLIKFKGIQLSLPQLNINKYRNNFQKVTRLLLALTLRQLCIIEQFFFINIKKYQQQLLAHATYIVFVYIYTFLRNIPTECGSKTKQKNGPMSNEPFSIVKS